MAEQYVMVYADSIEGRDASGSVNPGWETEGRHVYWDENDGFIGTGWYFELVSTKYHGEMVTARGPFYGKDIQYVEQELTKGNLNDVFDEWVGTIPIDERSAWISYLETETAACVGQ